MDAKTDLTPPRLVAPAGACDCHMHVFDPRFPARSDSPYPAIVATVDNYRAVRRRLGLSRCVVIQSVTHGADNANLVAALEAFAGSARGVAVVMPGIEDDELAALHDAGVRGIRFEMANGVLGWDALDEIAARIAPMGWHVDLQTGGHELPALAGRLTHLPCPVVIDHYGKFVDAVPADHPSVRAVVELIEANGWVKLTAPYAGSHLRPAPWPELVPIARAYLAAAPGRVLWGSEFPQSVVKALGEPVPDHAGLLDLLLDYADGEGEIERVLVSNPAELYDFPADPTK